ncbi:MAG: hypothetical protein ACK4YU_11320, partial [Paracoccus sp. (in: a-proteobacteria)]
RAGLKPRRAGGRVRAFQDDHDGDGMTRLQQVIRSRPFKIYALLAVLMLALLGVRLGADYLDQRVRFEARLLSDPEFDDLERRLEQFMQAYRASDADTMAAMLPPGYLEHSAAQRDRQPEWVRAAFRANYEDLFADIEVTRATFDPTIWRTGAGRDDLVLAQVETRIGFDPGTGPRFMHFPIFAIRDGGEWWLLHVTNARMREVLLEAYPDVEGLARTEDFLAL